MQASLRDPMLKVERAREHLDVLQAKLVESQQQHPFGVHQYEDITTSTFILQVETPIIAPGLALIAGDAIYNLRSALDQLAWQLALVNTDQPYEYTFFPIYGVDTHDHRKTFDRVTADIPPDAVSEMRSLQPFAARGPDYQADPLWELNRLYNIDRHRLRLLYGTSIDFKVPAGVEHRCDVFNGNPAVFVPISASPQMKLAPPPTADIFVGSEDAQSQVNLSELSVILEYVRDTVFPRFSGFFPG